MKNTDKHTSIAVRKATARFVSRILLLCMLALLLTGCLQKEVEKVQTPAGMNMERGRNYKEVIEDFEDKGFTNIKTEPIHDLLISWVIRNGEVDTISVGGDTNYDPGVWVPADTEVIIRYHTYIENAAEPEEDAGEGATQ